VSVAFWVFPIQFQLNRHAIDNLRLTRTTASWMDRGRLVCRVFPFQHFPTHQFAARPVNASLILGRCGSLLGLKRAATISQFYATTRTNVGQKAQTSCLPLRGHEGW